MKINGKFNGTLGVKRLYLEGLGITEDCPNCKQEVVLDTCMDYPEVNTKEPLYFYCDNCETSFTKYVIIELNIKEVTE